jgi:hypothetical protein
MRAYTLIVHVRVDFLRDNYVGFATNYRAKLAHAITLHETTVFRSIRRYVRETRKQKRNKNAQSNVQR